MKTTPLAALALLLAPLSARGDDQGGATGNAPITDRPHLGAFLQPVRRGERAEGIRVVFVYPGSSAARMGLLPGDEVVELDGQAVESRPALAERLRGRDIGSPLALRVVRAGRPLELKAVLGSFHETRKSFLDDCRSRLVGKPFETVAELVWPDGRDGIRSARGRVLVLISIDDCQDCVERKLRRIQVLADALKRAGKAEDWLALAAIYSDVEGSYARNSEARQRVLARCPVEFPMGIARYPRDEVPQGTTGREPLVQDFAHGLAILDPEGRVLFLELGTPGPEFVKAFQEAEAKYGKPAAKAGGPGETGRPPGKG
jgi:PDZ domain-containing protein